MPTYLSIETSAEACNVSLIRDGKIVTRQAEQPRSHARMLAPLIKELLSDESAELDGVCVDAGPGSYTGLRIGVSTAKGLAWSLGIPVYAVSSLALMAAGAVLQGRVAEDGKEEPRFRAIIPARGHECYSALFSWTGSEMDTLENPAIITLEDLKGRSHDDVLIVSSPSLAERMHLLDESVSIIEPHSRQASLLLRNQGEVYRVEDVSSFEPLYLKAFEARKPAVSIFDRLPF